EPVDALAGEGDRACIGREHPRDDVEQRGLAGAIRADHRKDRALLHAETYFVDCEQAAEALADRTDGQERRHDRFSVTPSLRGTQGQMPSGSASPTTRRQTP